MSIKLKGYGSFNETALYMGKWDKKFDKIKAFFNNIFGTHKEILLNQLWNELNKMVAGIHNYRLGVMLLDLEDPSIVLARCDHPVFSPNTFYERVGHGMNVVFTCGAFKRDYEIWMYYGAADTCIGLATAKLSDLIDAARNK